MMLTEKGDINWVETLAQIAEDKGNQSLGQHIRGFNAPTMTITNKVIPEMVAPSATVTPSNTVDYSGLSNHFAKSGNYNITVMPEQHCDGCA